MTFLTLYSKDQGHAAISALWSSIKPLLQEGKRLTLKVEEERRSSEQNRLLWAALSDVSQQVEWHGQHLTPEEWKHVFSAGLKRQRAVPGIDGGFVVLGQSTSRMSKAEFSELIELIRAFGAERDVVFHDQG